MPVNHRRDEPCNVSTWMDEATHKRLLEIQHKLQMKFGFSVPKGSVVKYLINDYDLEK